MTLFLRLRPGLLFLMAAISLIIGSARAQAPAAEFPHEVSPFGLHAEPGIVWGRLDNGLRYAIMANRTPPDVVALRMHVAVGSLDEPAELNGIAHLLEHLAFQSTARRPDTPLFPALERLGIAAGSHSNASTGLEETEYRLRLPRKDPALLEEAVRVFRDIADGLLLRPEDVEQERAVVISELRGRETAEALAQRSLLEFLAPGAAAARQWPGGTLASLNAITRTAVEGFYRRHYRPERMMIVIVGDIDPAVAQALLTKGFADFAGRGTASEPVDREAGIDLPGRLRAAVTRAPDLPARLGIYFPRDYVSVLRSAIAYAGANRLTPAPEEVTDLRRDLLQRDLAQDFIAAAFRRRMSELGFTEAPGFSSGGLTAFRIARAGYVDGFAFAPVGSDWRSALAVARRELERLLRHGLSDDEVDLARRSVEMALESGTRRAPTRDSAGLADGIVGATVDGFVFRHPEELLADFRAVAPRVTTERVNRLIRELYASARPAIHLRLPELAEGENEEVLLAAWSGAAAGTVEPWPEKQETSFAYSDFGPPGEIVESSRIEDFGIEKRVFANHVVAHIRPTDFERDTVRFLIRIGDGPSAFAPDEVNLMVKATQWAVFGGLGEHDFPTLGRIFADKSVSLRFGIDMNGISIAGAALEHDLPLALARATAMVVDLAFRSEAEPLFARRMGDFYERVRSTPRGVLQIDAIPFLHDGDRRPAGLPVSLARALEPDRESVIARLAPLLAGDYLEIAMVGAITPERAGELIAATLGALPERAERPQGTRRVMAHFAGAGSHARFTYAGKDAGGLAARIWPQREAMPDDEARPLQLLGQVLDILAREVVREAGGKSYAPQASTDLDPEDGWRGYVMLSADGPSDDLDAVGMDLEGLLSGVAGGNLDADLLERARRPALEQIRAMRDSNGGWLYGILDGLGLAPDRLERLRGVEAAYAALTTDDIVAAARRLVASGAPVAIKIVPAAQAGNHP